jgi:hypothetical protein
MTQDPPPLYPNFIARPLGYTVLDTQETQKVVALEYHDFLPLFLGDGSRQLPLKQPDIEYEINLQPDFHPLVGPLYDLLSAELKAQRNGWMTILKKSLYDYYASWLPHLYFLSKSKKAH